LLQVCVGSVAALLQVEKLSFAAKEKISIAHGKPVRAKSYEALAVKKEMIGN